MAKLQTSETSHNEATISREEILARLHDSGWAMVNVMPSDSFKAGHIAGSLNLPLMDIEAKARQLLADLNQEVAVYCSGPT